MKTNQLIISIIIVVLVGIAGFYGGMKYQQNKLQNFSRQGAAFGPRTNGSRNQFAPVNGEIIAADNNSITVKLQDGSSKIVIVSANTQISKAATGIISDLKTGERVVVFGSSNSDGSLTAQNIQLNPQERRINPSGSPKP